jgi:hypothetical protein
MKKAASAIMSCRCGGAVGSFGTEAAPEASGNGGVRVSVVL